MRNILFTIIILFTINIYSQSPISVTKDPFNLAINKALQNISIKDLKQATEATEKLTKIKDLYKEWDDNIKIVSDVIKTSKTVLDIKDISLELGKKYNKYVGELTGKFSLSNDDSAEIIYYYTVILNDGINELGSFKNLIGEGKLKMNDYERMILLNDIRKKLNYQLGLMNYLHKKIEIQRNKDIKKMKSNSFFKSNNK